MNEEEYQEERKRLIDEIARNEKIHCNLVAKRIQRELDKLDERYKFEKTIPI